MLLGFYSLIIRIILCHLCLRWGLMTFVQLMSVIFKEAAM